MNAFDFLQWRKWRPLTHVKGRQRSFIEIPSFIPSAADGALGAAYVVLQYNYEVAKNFIITQLPVRPVGAVDWIPAIRYRVGEDQVFRYKLWDIEGFEGMFQAPLYNGEIIKANFVIEIWTASGFFQNETAIPIEISLTTDSVTVCDVDDLRAALAIQCLDLENAIPALDTTNVNAWYRSDNGVTLVGNKVTDWSSLIAGGPTLSGGAGPDYDAADAEFNLLPSLEFDNIVDQLASPALGAFPNQRIVLVLMQKAWAAGDLVLSTSNWLIQQDVSTPRIYIDYAAHNGFNDQFPIDELKMLTINTNGAIGTKLFSDYSIADDVATSHVIGSAVNYVDTDTFILGQAGIKVAEFIALDQSIFSTTKANNLIQYFNYRYGNRIPVAMTFSDCAIGDNNF